MAREWTGLLEADGLWMTLTGGAEEPELLELGGDLSLDEPNQVGGAGDASGGDEGSGEQLLGEDAPEGSGLFSGQSGDEGDTGGGMPEGTNPGDGTDVEADTEEGDSGVGTGEDTGEGDSETGAGEEDAEESEEEEDSEEGYSETEDSGFAVPGWLIGGAAGMVLGAALTSAVFLTLSARRRRASKARRRGGRQDSRRGPDGRTQEPHTEKIPGTELAEDAGSGAAAPAGRLAVYVGKLHEIGARESQQDSFAVSPAEMTAQRGLLMVVADGMGGLADGDKVSQAATSAMMEGFYSVNGAPDQVLLELLARANAAVNRLLGPGGLTRSGSTMVAALIRDGQFYYFSVGDSRIALMRDGILYQLNRDHVYRNDLVLNAVNGTGTVREAFAHPKGGGLASYLGMGKLKYVDIPARPLELREGDRFILMSDGVYNALTPQEIRDGLRYPAQEAADALRSAIQAKQYRTQDNYTAVVLEIRAAG